ncbi:hypothetical protein FLGE108171_15155 [Flavobacterium gelidilacus]|uniref:hypothetical protein n=1 Tax=Flavobacterium gelidilacus TaxID=206041 RepID=UPI0003FBD26F|nr:hypothetical protein [Flavobacterium gelidilacus]
MQVLKKEIFCVFILLILFFSCKENINISSNPIIENQYKRVSLNCKGDDYNTLTCENIQKEISLNFKNEEGKSLINFKYKNQNFIHVINEQISDLGIESFLFENDNKMILILDSFLEFGHKFYVYEIKNDSIKFVGFKELNSKFDDKDIELKYIFNLSEKENLLNINLGPSYEEISLNLNKASLLLTKNNDQDILNKKIDYSGSWKLNCDSELLTFEIAANNIYLFLNSDNSIYINTQLKKVMGKENEYDLHFLSTESQNNFYEEIGNIKDEEISKEESIAKIVILDDNTISIFWKGLYDMKTKKRVFYENFVFLKENNDVNPIILKKCN